MTASVADAHRPLIVTAELGRDDFAWLNGLRRQHFPAERNQLSAHLTMFHALPPSVEGEVCARLAQLAKAPPPRAWVDGLMNLGGGTALRVVSDDLDAIRADLARDLHGLLTAQDGGGWRPHVTIQNKVTAKEARALQDLLQARDLRRPLAIHGLGLHRYMGGPWEKLAAYAFRGVS